MWNVNTAYVDGKFVRVRGSEAVEVVNPATEQIIGTATLGNRDAATCSRSRQARAMAIASRLQAGTVLINQIDPDPLALYEASSVRGRRVPWRSHRGCRPALS